MIDRYDIYETWTGMNIDIDQEGGEWVTYEDHAGEIATLRALAREAVKEAYAEAFDDAWNLARGLDADDDLIQEGWLKSGAACDFKEGDV